MKFSFFKSGIKNKVSTSVIDLEYAFHVIRSSTYAETIQRIRKSSDKNVRSVLKKNLDYFTFSGIFQSRKSELLQEHSRYICIDFDLNSEEVNEYNINNIKYLLSLDDHTALCFTSPSGTGIKVIVRVEIDPALSIPQKLESHLQYFNSLSQYYLSKYGLEVDVSGKDVSRACFVSYDPLAFYNPRSSVYSLVHGSLKVYKDRVPLPPEYEYKVDLETGEVIDLAATGETIEWDIEKEKQKWTKELENHLQRCKDIVERIEAKKIDITGNYQDWLYIGMSFSIFGEQGRSMFHAVSKYNDGYKEPETNAKFDELLKNTKKFTTPQKFYTVARAYDVDIRPIRRIGTGVAEGVDAGQNYSEKWNFAFPENCEDTPEKRSHVWGYHFLEHENRYWFGEFDNNTRTVTFSDVSNFVIIPRYLIQSRAEPKRIIEIENVFGDRKLLEIPAKAFVSLTEFNAFTEGQGNFLSDFDKRKFLKVKSKLYELTKPALEIRTLGWQSTGCYAFANGVYRGTIFNKIDELGFVKDSDEQYYFLPALSNIYKGEEEEFKHQKKFILKKSKVKFEEWSKTFCETYADNGKIGLLYYITSIYRDHVYNQFKFFPHIFLFGLPGSGKSTMAWSITNMFGESIGPFLLPSGTPVAFHKRFAIFRNAVIWFDEYKNSIDPKRIEFLKGAYDGSGHEKSEMTSDNRTKNIPVNSGCIISGQELPIADNALFKRTVLLTFDRTEYTQEDKTKHQVLTAMESQGLSHITAALSTLRPMVDEHYMTTFDTLYKEFRDELTAANHNIEERAIKNMLVFVTTFKVLEGTLNFPFTYEEIKALSMQAIISQNELMNSSKETSTFWDMVSYMVDMGTVKPDCEFVIKTMHSVTIDISHEEKKNIVLTREEKGKKVLYLRLGKIHPVFMELMRKRGKDGMDKNSLNHYLQSMPCYLGLVYSVRFKESKSSAFIFDYEELQSMTGIDLERLPDSGDIMPGESYPEVPTSPTSPLPSFADQLSEEEMPF